jgi:hypothetical protein
MLRLCLIYWAQCGLLQTSIPWAHASLFHSGCFHCWVAQRRGVAGLLPAQWLWFLTHVITVDHRPCRACRRLYTAPSRWLSLLRPQGYSLCTSRLYTRALSLLLKAALGMPWDYLLGGWTQTPFHSHRFSLDAFVPTDLGHGYSSVPATSFKWQGEGVRILVFSQKTLSLLLLHRSIKPQRVPSPWTCIPSYLTSAAWEMRLKIQVHEAFLFLPLSIETSDKI